ncbi:thiamine-phosphate kinase [Planctomycetota bacterium]
MSEFDFIEWIRGQNARQTGIPVGIGDDAAIVDISDHGLLAVTSDTIVQDIDFHVNPGTLFGIGWKALCISLSDIAAMGLPPLAATCTMSVPPEIDRLGMEEIYRGLKTAADRFQCPVIGGDLSAAPKGGLSLTSTVFGTGNNPVTRDAAAAGDVIAVTGQLGGSLLGKHLNFTPRIAAGLHLNLNYEIHAMIDISDGLSGDLQHICRASGAGGLLIAEKIPVSQAAKEHAADTGTSSLEHALHDGEDFELLFTMAKEEWDKLAVDKSLDVMVTEIGEITSSEDLQIIQDGKKRELQPRSFTHKI